MATIGIELTPTHVRAVRYGWRGAQRSAELEWSPEAPDAAAAQLRESLGVAASVRLAVHPLLLRVKELHLPAVAPAAQWRAIELQPSRYFAESDDRQAVAIAWHPDTRLAFAADADAVRRWTLAFGSLGTVQMILPGPLAMTLDDVPDGVYDMAPGAEVAATVVVAGGGLTSARVVRRATSDVEPLPPFANRGGAWRAAIGAAQRRVAEDWESLATPPLQRQLRSQRLRGFAAVAAGFALAVVGLFVALDQARSAHEARLDRAIAGAERLAQPGLALRRRLAGLDEEAQLLRSGHGTAPDIVQALAHMSELLPRGVVLTRLRVNGDEWQASGRARGGEAAAIVPALERDGRFTDVRMTSPSTRFREDAQEYESFAVAFRVRPAD
jgi:Tfp pilus assembly protein PilN